MIDRPVYCIDSIQNVNMEFFRMLVPIVAVLVTGIFTKLTFLSRGMKKLRASIESNVLFDRFDSSFCENFVYPNLEESYFYEKTGIDANKQMIPKYIAFRDDIGEDCKWSTVKIIKNHLKPAEDKLKIYLSKWQIRTATIAYFVGLMLCFAGISTFYLSTLCIKISISDFIYAISCMFLFISLGLFIIFNVSSILIARGIQKKFFITVQ